MHPAGPLPNIEALVTDGCEITVGAIAHIESAATACDEAQCLAMLVKGDDETLGDLLRRLDRAIGDAQEHDCPIDEINAKS